MRREIAMNIGATNSRSGSTWLVDCAQPNIRPARAAANAAVDDLAVERKAVDVHQQRDVVLADLGHVAVEKVAVTDPGALALIDGKAEMGEHLALRLDDARIDVVPVERDDAVHSSDLAAPRCHQSETVENKVMGVNRRRGPDANGVRAPL